MSLRNRSSESTDFQTTTDETDTILEDEHTNDTDDDESTSEDESGTDSDDETEDEEGEEEYHNEEDIEREDDASFLVPIEKNRSPNKQAHTEKLQAQQRRMVSNLSASVSASSHDDASTAIYGEGDEDDGSQTDDATNTDGGCSTAGNTTDGGGEGYSTAGGYTTHDDGRGGGYTTEGGYTTATGTGTVSCATRSDDTEDDDDDDDGDSTYDDEDENETNRGYSTPGVNTLSTGEFGRSGSYSVASQSTATTQPTSPSRKKVTSLTVTNDDMNGDGIDDLANLATPDINNRVSLLQSSVTPRTGHGKSTLSPPVFTSSQQLSPRMKERVPGGAAAKLMLLGPRGSKESEEGGEYIERMSSAESSVKINPDAVLAAEVARVKEEFSTGNTKQDRSKMIPPSLTVAESEMNEEKDDAENSISLSMKPSFLNPNEIFHPSAADAVAALLKPRQISPIHEGVVTVPTSPAPFFSSPRTGALRTPDSTSATAASADPSNPNGVVSSELISAETKRKVEELESKMISPTKTLTDLLTAIATPDDPIPDQLAYAVRRKNACGALLTLTINAGNRVRICWTTGVLPALKSVLADGLIVNGETTSPLFLDDERIRTEYDAARNRAISALLNLCMPVKNRIAVFHTPGLVQVVLDTMDQDHGAARKGCSAIMAFLAKSSENRLLMVQIPGLLELARRIIKPRPARVEVVTTPPMKEKKSYPWSDDDDDATSTSSSLRDRNKMGSGTTESKRKNRPGLSFVSTTSSFQSYDDSGDTPKVEGANSPREVTGYDETADELLQAARQNVFAMLGHLVKEKDNAYHLARCMTFVTTLVDIALCHETPSHALSIKIIANLTRHRLNKVLAFKPKTVVPALVEATQSSNDDARLYACYALQNLSQEKSCRQELAIAEHLIDVLCDRCRNGTLDAERLAAVSTLKNLCDEPANLIPLTNTTGCVTTLMQLAHSAPHLPTTTALSTPVVDNTHAPSVSQSSSRAIAELMQYRACDALATLSHWLRKIATSGHSLEQTQRGRMPNKGLFVPSLREVSWNQWT